MIPYSINNTRCAVMGGNIKAVQTLIWRSRDICIYTQSGVCVTIGLSAAHVRVGRAARACLARCHASGGEGMAPSTLTTRGIHCAGVWWCRCLPPFGCFVAQVFRECFEYLGSRLEARADSGRGVCGIGKSLVRHPGRRHEKKTQVTITGGHNKQDLLYSAHKPIHFPIFTINNVWSYLIWSPVISITNSRCVTQVVFRR